VALRNSEVEFKIKISVWPLFFWERSGILENTKFSFNTKAGE